MAMKMPEDNPLFRADGDTPIIDKRAFQLVQAKPRQVKLLRVAWLAPAA
jgi:hypothetical protein